MKMSSFRRSPSRILVHHIQFTGAPLSAAKRVQFNFELEPIEGIEQMKNLPKVTFPWIWIEEGANLPSWMIYLIKFGLIM